MLAAIAFLVEGAVLDWGALLILERRLAPAEQAGLGYMLFSIAMTVGRLTGDRVVAAVGGLRILLWGGIVTVLGLIVIAILSAARRAGGIHPDRRRGIERRAGAVQPRRAAAGDAGRAWPSPR